MLVSSSLPFSCVGNSLSKKKKKLVALQGVSVVCGKLQTMTDATELISKKKTGGV